MAASREKQRPSFDPPEESEWHRMIAEGAYYLAQKRGFLGEHSLDDWLAAEQQVRQMISPQAAGDEIEGNALKPDKTVD